MSWYHYVGIVMAVVPTIWVWMFIGGSLLTLITWFDDHSDLLPKNSTDESEWQAWSAIWPVAIVIALLWCVGWLVKRAALTPGKLLLTLRRSNLPKAKVVK